VDLGVEVAEDLESEVWANPERTPPEELEKTPFLVAKSGESFIITHTEVITDPDEVALLDRIFIKKRKKE
jgi:hypothetical protein